MKFIIEVSTDRGVLSLTDDKTFEELVFDTPGKAAAAAAEFMLSYMHDKSLQAELKVSDISVKKVILN
jgi:hypothetical protein